MLIKKIYFYLKARKYKKLCHGFKGSPIGLDIVNCSFEENVFIAHHAQIKNSHIGNHSSIGRFDKIRDAIIGKYCSISWDVTIGAPTHPYTTITNCSLTYTKEYGVVENDLYFPQLKTTIGNDVWIGCDVTIISGISIGDGVIIGAGAVVTHDVPAYEIWAGVPAKRIGARFDNDIIIILEEIKWWDWSTSEIKDCLELFKKNLDLDTANKLRDYWLERGKREL